MTASLRGQSGDDSDDTWVRNSGPIGDNIVGGNLPLVPRVSATGRQQRAAVASGDEDQEDHFFDNDPYLCGPPDDAWTPDSSSSAARRGSDPFGSPANPLFAPTTQGDPYNTVMPNAPGQLDLDYYLKEARTGRLMFGVGVNSSSGLVGSIVLRRAELRPVSSPHELGRHRRWHGLARSGTAVPHRAMPGTEVSRYTVSWSDPYIFHTNWNLGVSGYYFQRYYLTGPKTASAAGSISAGSSTPEWSVTAALRLEGVRIADVTVPTPESCKRSWETTSSARSAVRSSTTRATCPSCPAKGTRLEVTYEQGFGQFIYPRVEADARQYFTALPAAGRRRTANPDRRRA